MKTSLIALFISLFLLGSIVSAAPLTSPASQPTYVPHVTVSPQPSKPNIALVINSDLISQLHEKTPKAIRAAIQEKFPISQFNLKEDKTFYQDVLIAMEDEKILDMASLSRETLSNIGKKHGYDYVVLLVYNYGTSDYSSSFWSSTYKAAVVLIAKVVDVQTKEYLYRQDLSVAGKSADGFGNPSFQSAVNKSMINTTNKFCEEINISPIKKPIVQ